MVTNLALEVLILGFEIINKMLLLQDLQEVLRVIEVSQVLDSLVDVDLKTFKLIQSLVREILRWRSVVLHALQV